MLTNPKGLNDLTGVVIAAAIDVHKETGPGLLEQVYTECLALELRDRGLNVERAVKVPLNYRGRALSTFYVLDLRVNNTLIIEVKSVEALAPVHTAQLLTYLKLTNSPVGLLINFNVPVLKDGVKRVVSPKVARTSEADSSQRRHGEREGTEGWRS
jgi:GxxExxY protein